MTALESLRVATDCDSGTLPPNLRLRTLARNPQEYIHPAREQFSSDFLPTTPTTAMSPIRSNHKHDLAQQKMIPPPANSTPYSLASAPTPQPLPKYQSSQCPRPQLLPACPQDAVAVTKPIHCSVSRTAAHLFWTLGPLTPAGAGSRHNRLVRTTEASTKDRGMTIRKIKVTTLHTTLSQGLDPPGPTLVPHPHSLPPF